MQRPLRPAAAFVLASLGAAAALAGPLNPPLGPITSTPKPLTEVEPRTAINATNTPGDADSLFKITQPGSYYLTGNIAGVVGKHGIKIATGGVTLDLNGFDLVGATQAGAFNGVTIGPGDIATILVTNGSVRNWSGDGINLGSSFSSYNEVRVERVRASGNAGMGIRAGEGCLVWSCSAYANTSGGLNVGRGATIRDCHVRGGSVGIEAAFNSNTSGCTVEFADHYAFLLQGGATITDSVAVGTSSSLSESAFWLGAGSTAVNCVARSNSGAGFITQVECSLQGCSATNNTGTGFVVTRGTLSHCSAFSNLAHGISISSGGCVADCTTQFNAQDGILCDGNCTIRRNTCATNGLNAGSGAGIHATGAGNQFEDNRCINADRGIEVNSSGNVIVRNICSGNTQNWNVVANNTILVVQLSNAGAVVGNAGGTAPGSTDPNANFTY